jgi:hypothetical protein
VDKEIPQPINSEEEIVPRRWTYRRTAILVASVLLVILLGLLGYSAVAGRRTTSPIPTPTPTMSATPTASPSGEPTATPTVMPTAVPGGTLFVSHDLGISFSYATTALGTRFTAKEVGNTIHVYDPQYGDTTGQYVQAFDKNPSDSIQDAITKIVLKGYSTADCVIRLNPDNAKVLPSANNRPASYETASLTYASAAVSQDKCPSPYTATQSQIYFLEDTAHPGKLIFIYAPQQSIPASTDSSVQLVWQDTIKVL